MAELQHGVVRVETRRAAGHALDWFDPRQKGDVSVAKEIDELIAEALEPVRQDPGWDLRWEKFSECCESPFKPDTDRLDALREQWVRAIAKDFSLTKTMAEASIGPNEFIKHKRLYEAMTMARAELALAIHIAKICGSDATHLVEYQNNGRFHKEGLQRPHGATPFAELLQ